MSFKVMTAKEMIEVLISEGGTATTLSDNSILMTHPDHPYSLWLDNNDTWHMIDETHPLPKELMS